MKIDRKKEVKNKNKNKWIIGGVIAFASVALIGSGFATWVIGVTTATNKGNITLDVDNASRMDVALVSTLKDDDKTISLKEPNTTDPLARVKVTGNEGITATDLSVSFSALTVTYGQDIKFQLTIDLDDTSKALLQTRNSATQGNFKEGEEGYYTYIDFNPITIDLTKASTVTEEDPTPDVTKTSSTDSSGTITYKWDATSYANSMMYFTWGTLFNHKQPSTYYNEWLALYTDSTDENGSSTSVSNDNSTNQQAIYDELNTMHTNLDDKTLTFVITVSAIA